MGASISISLTDEAYKILQDIQKETQRGRSEIINSLIITTQNKRTITNQPVPEKGISDLTTINLIDNFTHECIRTDPEGHITKEDFLTKLKDYCKEHKDPVPTVNDIYRTVKNNMHFQEARIQDKRSYLGISWK